MQIFTDHHAKGLRYSLKKMEELGYFADDCLRGTNIHDSDLDNPDYKIELEQELLFNENLINISGNPLIGLQIGEAYPPMSYGVVGYAIMSAKTFRDALKLIESYGELTYSLFRFRLVESTPAPRFSMSPKMKLSAKLTQFYADRDLSAALLTFSTILGKNPQYQRVGFLHNDVANREGYETYFGCPAVFNQPDTWMELSPESLNESLLLRDENTSRLCQEQCKLLIAKLNRQIGFVNEVRHLILSYPREFSTMQQCAQQMNISLRTLQRRLANEGASYQNILDNARYKLAKSYLKDTKMTVEQISVLLGYSDPGNFSHAFKRWSDCSPKAWRTRNQQAIEYKEEQIWTK